MDQLYVIQIDGMTIEVWTRTARYLVRFDMRAGVLTDPRVILSLLY